MGGFHLFTLASVPVWISPWYLFLLYMFLRRTHDPVATAAIVTTGLLVHEFGHALMARRFKLPAEILLHGFGGLTSHPPAKRDRDDALIVAAGPLAGLLLALGAWTILKFAPIHSARLIGALDDACELNLYWSIFNLLPMWPMDGGQLLRLGMLKLFKSPVQAEKVTHMAGVAMAALVALMAFSGATVLGFRLSHGQMLLFILVLTGWQNVQALMAGGSGQTIRRDNPRVKELLASAERAFTLGDDREAARLCHLLRSESNLPPNVLAKAWAILGVSTTRLGEYQEALSYLKRAPDIAEVVEATAQCFYQLDMLEELDALTHSKAFERLPRETQQQITGALREASMPPPASSTST